MILLYSLKCQKNVHTINKDIDVINTNLAIENEKLNQINCDLLAKKDSLSQEIENNAVKLDQLNKAIENDYEKKKILAQNTYELYFEKLENKYERNKQEHFKNIQKLKEDYEEKKIKLQNDIEIIENDLQSIKNTRAAAISAKIKEKEIKEKSKFYMLNLSSKEIDDIQKLEKIKKELHNPRILSMLIWSTFFQKPMNTLCNNILGNKITTGIYKITNQNNDMCYIGQSVDIATRWKNHAKCGLGIDTPSENKLYKDMIAEGIWNFSWELIEECPKEKLNEKEKFYISLYQSKDFGYNLTKGNK